MVAETSMDSRLSFNCINTNRCRPFLLIAPHSTVIAICSAVIAGRSRPKDGVASLAYDPAIQLFTK